MSQAHLKSWWLNESGAIVVVLGSRLVSITMPVVSRLDVRVSDEEKEKKEIA